MFKHVKNPEWKIVIPQNLNEIPTTCGRSCQGCKIEFKRKISFFFKRR